MFARFSNRVMFLRKVSLTVPVAPLRFLARSARRCRAGRWGRNIRGGGAAGRGRRPARSPPIRAGRPSAGWRSSRFSTARLSCERAMTGTSSSRASVLSRRLILAICSCRLSRDSSLSIELDVVDHDQAEVLAELEPAGVGRDLEHVPRGRVVDEQRRGCAARRSPCPAGSSRGSRGSCPVRSLWPSTRDRAQSSRSASSSRPISRLTKSTAVL